MLELGGAVVSVLDRLDREDVRLLPLRRVVASAVGLRWVRRQHSPLVAMHHMILCARRKIFEITTKPNRWMGLRAGRKMLYCKKKLVKKTDDYENEGHKLLN